MCVCMYFGFGLGARCAAPRVLSCLVGGASVVLRECREGRLSGRNEAFPWRPCGLNVTPSKPRAFYLVLARMVVKGFETQLKVRLAT